MGRFSDSQEGLALLEKFTSPPSLAPGLGGTLWVRLNRGPGIALQAKGLTKTSLALRCPQAKGLSPYQEASTRSQIPSQVVPEAYKAGQV